MPNRALPDPLTWYPLELPFTMRLLETYIEQIETQVTRGINEFRKGEGTEGVEVSDESVDTVAVHKGIHSGLWDLRPVFEGYMPNLQHRSALITLFSSLESELDRLCERVLAREGSAVQVTDLADKGIARATTYLVKVGSLTGIRNSQTWMEIRNIQAIRNLIVHSEGLLPDASDGRRAKMASSPDRLRNTKIKNIRQLICAIAGSTKPWEVVVGQAIGALDIVNLSASETGLAHFLGIGATRALLRTQVAR